MYSISIVSGVTSEDVKIVDTQIIHEDEVMIVMVNLKGAIMSTMKGVTVHKGILLAPHLLMLKKMGKKRTLSKFTAHYVIVMIIKLMVISNPQIIITLIRRGVSQTLLIVGQL